MLGTFDSVNAEDLSAQELVAAAMELLEAENAPQLADRLGMTRRNQDKTVRRWIEGENEPNYGATLRLLTEVGLLPRRLPARAKGQPWRLGGAATPSEDDAELVRELEELADLLERLQQIGSSIGRRAAGS